MLLISAAQAMCEAPPPDVLPEDGSTDVPIDVQVLWIYEGEVDPPVLLDPDGVEVPVRTTTNSSAGMEQYVTLTPAEVLLPETTYTVVSETTSSTFTTGDRLADAPSVPTPSVTADVDDGITCGADGSSSVTEDAEHAWTLVDGGVPAGSHLVVEVSAADWEGTVMGESPVRLSWGGCYRPNLPDVRDLDALDISTRTVNEAGVSKIGRAHVWTPVTQ